jgi:hypothetical protein
MKSILAAFVIALVLLPGSAYASCPNITYGACCGVAWYEYSFALTCAGTSGSIAPTTLSCSYPLTPPPAYQFNGTSATVTYSYTIGANDPMMNPAHWSAGLLIDLDDPSASQYNTLNATVSVTHNGSTTSNTIVSRNGTQGTVSCTRYDYYYFTAVAGDTITVTITGTNFNSGSTKIRASEPFLFSDE